jgi:hypothetical protein
MARLIHGEYLLTNTYISSVKMVKEKIPKERLLVIRLEDGLGWEQICPFLEMPIPEEEYPRGNEPEKFKALLKGYMAPRMRNAMVKLATLVVPVVGVGAWLAMKHGPALYVAAMG